MSKRYPGYFKDIKCHKCGSNTTYVYHGSPKWYNDIDDNGNFIGKICSNCYRHKRENNINDINNDNTNVSNNLKRILIDNDEVIGEVVRSSIKERKCCKCGSEDTYVSIEGPKWRKYYENDKWDRKSWLCNKCSSKEYYDKFIKHTYKCRNKELPKSSTKGKGFIGEQIFAIARGAKNCNIEMDNFNFVYDVYDEEFGKVQVKARKPYYGDWNFSGIFTDNYDTVVLICMDKRWENVLRVYIIPNECINSRKISIIGNPHPSIGSKWEEFRIEYIKIYNDAYHNMSINKCSVLKDE